MYKFVTVLLTLIFVFSPLGNPVHGAETTSNGHVGDGDVLFGDCDDNELVDSDDLVALRHLVFMDVETPPAGCDANDDGDINVADSACISLLIVDTPCQPLPNETSRIGSNLAEVADWSSGWIFVDAFKSSRPWITQNEETGGWDTQEAHLLDLDENGYVKRLPDVDDMDVDYRFVGTLMFRDIEDHYPAGEYIVLYDGEGVIEYGYAATKESFGELMPASSTRQHPSTRFITSTDGTEIEYIFSGVKNHDESEEGRDVITVTPNSNGIYMRITETNPDDHIRNIRVILPGFEDSYDDQVFHPDFLANIAPYHELRFMDWMRTNDSTEQIWEDRPQVGDPTYATEAGVPLEIMLMLTNQVGVNPWFNMPHLATDEYMSSFAQMVKDSLFPGQKVYVEYSNELWNMQFEQALWVHEQAIDFWNLPDVPVWEDSYYTERLNWIGMRSAQTCDLWKAVWGDDADRVVCVMGAQAAIAPQWAVDVSLDCPMWEEGAPCQAHGIDAIAIAPYFAQYIGWDGNVSVLESWLDEPDGGLDMLFTEIMTGGLAVTSPNILSGSVDIAIGNMALYATDAVSRELDLVAYEGGQHLVASHNIATPEIINLFAEANRDPRMGVAYDRYFAGWEAIGGGTFAHFYHMGLYGRDGSWGAVAHYGQTDAWKYEALLGYGLDGAEERAGDGVAIMPALSIPTTTITLTLPGQSVTMPVQFDPNGHNVSSVAFSIDYDETVFTFDTSDEDADGIPDAIHFNTSLDFTTWISVSVSDTDGEIDIMISDDTAPLDVLFGGTLLEVVLNAGIPTTEPATIGFSQSPAPFFGTRTGLQQEGIGIDGAVQFETITFTEAVYLPVMVQ